MTYMAQNRRRFLATFAATGAAGLVDLPNSNAQDGQLETTTVRIGKIAGICIAPQYVAEELLRAEGFTDIRYVLTDPGISATLALARGEIDFTANFSPPLIIAIDTGEPITIVAGEHVGCFELFAREGIQSIPDLKGKTDAFLGLPPEPQELRARKIGHVIFNSATDRPWSQYFCCMLAGNRDYVRRNPVATKRVLRAVIKAAEVCDAQPERVAQRIVDAGFTPRYD